tara:strand:+ start:301 stop:471 length:171 start_codon:yes stop_codon:yes gene_type:complete
MTETIIKIFQKLFPSAYTQIKTSGYSTGWSDRADLKKEWTDDLQKEFEDIDTDKLQ